MFNSPENSRREHQRREHVIEARLMTEAQWHDCRLLDVSVGGAKVQHAHETPEGSSAWLEIGNFGKFRISIMWRRGEVSGIRFDHTPEEMAEVIMGLATYG